MQNSLSQLHDIEGIDSISFWPLAIAWWVIIFIALAMFATIAIIYCRKQKFSRSWRNSVLKQLANIEININKLDNYDASIELSELIRRIAIQLHSRKECAGLTGDKWLEWLTTNDPKQFDWSKNAEWIANVQYAKDISVNRREILLVVNSIRRWVK
jgi:hypothetical protein